MNILFIHEVDWLNKVVFDIHNLSELLSLRGHKVYAIDYEATWSRSNSLDFGSLKTKGFDRICRASQGASVCLRRPGFIKIPGLSRLSAGFTHYLEIHKIVKEKNIDVVVLYSVPTNGLQSIYLAKMFHIPVVFRSIDMVNQLVPHSLLRPITRIIEKIVYSKVDMILTITPKLSNYVISMGAKADKVKLLPIPVDTNLFYPSSDFYDIRKKWGFAEKDQIVVFMGTLFEFSGLDGLIREFHEVVEQIPQGKLLIIGDGPQRSKLEEIIDELNMREQVIITGFQPYETMPQYINLATICVSPFLSNNVTRDIFPSKIAQYLSCGKAVISTSLPGMVAVISGERDGVIYTSSVNDMTREIVSLLKSADRRHKLEHAALNYANQMHRHEAITRQFETTLEEAITRKRIKNKEK